FAASTAVLKITTMDCYGCAQRVKQALRQYKGVYQVSVDADAELASVTGTMDVDSLPAYLKHKHQINAEIVQVESPQVVVLRANIHCEGCGRKIKAHIKNLEGVLAVKVDAESNTVRVLGNVDPGKLEDHVRDKVPEDVEVVGTESPRNKEAAAALSCKRGGSFSWLFGKKPLSAPTVVLKTILDCKGCVDKVIKILLELYGVKMIHIDAEKGLVTVQGTVNADTLQLQLKKKLKREVKIVSMESDGEDNSGYRNEGAKEKPNAASRSGSFKMGGDDNGGGNDRRGMERSHGGRKERKKEEFGGGDRAGGFGGEKKKNRKKEEGSGGYGHRNGEEGSGGYGHRNGKEREEEGGGGCGHREGGEFLEAAERQQLEDPAIKYWVGELKDVAYDADDIIGHCMIEGAVLSLADRPSSSRRLTVQNKVDKLHNIFDCSHLSSCFASIPRRYEIAECIKALNDKLEEIYKDRLQFKLEESREQTKLQTITTVNASQTAPLVDVNVLGTEIEEDTKELLPLIVGVQAKKCRVIALTGMGGIGKTTLAQKIYNSKKIHVDFQYKVWISVSHNYDEMELLRHAIKKGTEGDGPLILGRAFFLFWMTFGAQMFGMEIFCKKVFLDEEEEIKKLKDSGLQIVKKCSGLPLAIEVIAGLLAANKNRSRREWERVLNNDLWSIRSLPKPLHRALYRSYDKLPSHLKQCFLYCSLFPENAHIYRDDLIRLWIAKGFIREQTVSLKEDIAEGYYNELIGRNLLLPVYSRDNHCRMHNLLRSMSIFLSKDEIFSATTMAATAISSSMKLRRLSIGTRNNLLAIKDLVVEQKYLRTLLTFNGIKVLNDNQLMGLKRIRVLKIDNLDVDSIPKSIGELMYLRNLNLNSAKIRELPESIGSLINLQFLYLRGCTFFTMLPKSITRLHNLRYLDLKKTPLISIPKGISKLEKINYISGFVVADPREPEDSYSSLEKLNSLYQLRTLSISRMERAKQGASSLGKLTRLIELQLLYTEAENQPLTAEEDITRIEDVLDKLCLPNAWKGSS
ncbi:putative disease resistance protein RGA4, partial [Phalaenopsis equestris]|uniref:putative disease resistance protein RGA4 n=1 Tax=Phalaenopsis equestris TaxID=78828 RepID=UPI0009E57DB8